MPVDQSLVGREFPATHPYRVSAEKVRELARAIGLSTGSPDQPVPATFPIVMAFEAMNAFLADVGVELHRIVHGEQRFSYERPIAVGDELTATLSVASLRQIGGNDIIGTRSEIRDAGGDLVCTTTATLVHRGGE
jgi:N-terminal half of MaoC dehydratase